MIYALNSCDVSDHERREIARCIRDGNHDILSQDKRVFFVRDTEVGTGCYYCVYCMEKVYKLYSVPDRIIFQHVRGKGCPGSDKGPSGIENPYGVTVSGDPDGTEI